MISRRIDFKLTYMVGHGRIGQCSVYPWIHNFDVLQDCMKCKNFIKVIPLHPYPAVECHARADTI